MSRHLRLGLLLLSFLLAISLLPAAAQDPPLAPDAVAGELYYAPFDVAITLDGDSADWAGVPRVELSGSAHRVVFAAAADGENLYLLGDVTDENIVSGEHDADYWNEDSIEFYINGTGDRTLRSYQSGVVQITVPPLNKDLAEGDAPILAGVQGATADAQVKVVGTGSGYLVELAVPLNNAIWNITPEHGAVIGFQVHLNGTSGTARDTKLIWSLADRADQSYQNPSVFGALMFFEIGQTTIPALPSANPTPAEMGEAVPEDAPYLDASLSPAERAEDLLARMTLDEKIGQMTQVEIFSLNPADLAPLALGSVLSGGGGSPPGNNTPEGWANMVDGLQELAMQSRLGIPIIYGVDAVHGHGNLYGATIFPHNIGLGATRNPALVEQVCHTTALEMIATGIYWNFAPVVAVLQDARWGRYYEGYGEDTALVSELASACIRGLQGDDLSAPTSVLATPKHFVGDGGAVWGTSTTGDYRIDQGVTDVDEETLRAIHLPPYAAAIAAGAQNVMISFSSWGGMKMHAQRYLITDVLKGELGFSGFIISDWGGIDQITANYYDAVVTAINAGVDMNMVPYDYIRFIDVMHDAVESGDIPMERIDDAVRRILTVKFELGLFERPFSDESLRDAVGSEAHRALARQAVAESQVLLKNEEVLPLSPDLPVVFVAGGAANDIGIQSGGWTIQWQGLTGSITPGTTILDGIEAAVSADTEVVFSRSGRFDGRAEVGIVVIGETPYAEGVGDDPDLSLSRGDIAAINNTREAVDKLVVVVISGRPLILTDLIDDFDALVAAWLPGTEGQGVADVLFGVQPFTGRLPVSWIASVDQLPLSSLLSSGEEPLFPFGYGLTTE